MSERALRRIRLDRLMDLKIDFGATCSATFGEMDVTFRMVDVRKARVYNDIYQELEGLAMKDDRLIDAFSAWEELSQTPESIIAYESRLKKIIDDEAKIDYARHKGEEKGWREGKEEVVRDMLSEGLPLEQVEKYAKLTIEQVKEIQNRLESQALVEY